MACGRMFPAFATCKVYTHSNHIHVPSKYFLSLPPHHSLKIILDKCFQHQCSFFYRLHKVFGVGVYLSNVSSHDETMRYNLNANSLLN